jgi:hypothetical protein
MPGPSLRWNHISSFFQASVTLLHPKVKQSVLETRSFHCREVFSRTWDHSGRGRTAHFSKAPSYFVFFNVLNPEHGPQWGMVCALGYLFCDEGDTGIWFGDHNHLAPWAMNSIPRQAVGYVRPLLNIKSFTSASVFPLRLPPDSQGHGHICPAIPRADQDGGGNVGRRLSLLSQTQKSCYSGFSAHSLVQAGRPTTCISTALPVLFTFVCVLHHAVPDSTQI